jgi:hypothetical protein
MGFSGAYFSSIAMYDVGLVRMPDESAQAIRLKVPGRFGSKCPAEAER